jgi:hypothetical protein
LPKFCLTNRRQCRARFRRPRGRVRVRRRAHSANQPAARDLQAPADGTPVEHQNGVPEKGRSGLVYDDQREAHRQIYAGDEVVDYAFMGTDPNSPDDRWLRDAMQQQIPVIYFLGTSPGWYQPIIPTFIVGWHPERLRVDLAFGVIVGASVQATLPTSPERRYALREIKARLLQASFRDAVLSAYGGRCTISHLPEPRLLDAAHIVMDAHEQLGQPIVSNGLPLTKIHHAAFDAHLIGIDPDFRIHVSERLLEIHDGPFLELGLKGIVGQEIQLPRRFIKTIVGYLVSRTRSFSTSLGSRSFFPAHQRAAASFSSQAFV